MSQSDSSEETIFEAARLLCDPDQQAAYLNAACGNDLTLRQRIEQLLRAGRKAKDFFQRQGAMLPTLCPQTVPVAPISEGPGTVIGRYKLLQQIGEGGCGVVYSAEQQEPVRRLVALKVIKPGMDTKSVIARFDAERQALALMDHPNIAKVLDAGATVAGRPFFVMELVRGVKITDYCDQNNLSTRERLHLFVQVCWAIQHAHQKGILHRDLKPSNVLVTSNDSDKSGVPKVIDFGIAKATQGRLTDQTLFTAFEQFIGTPAYMSPEQAEMNILDIDTRTDIYALGVLLYELLTGRTPFDAKELLAAGMDAMRRTIREQEPPKPSTRLTEELASKSEIRNLKSDIDEASSRRLLQMKELVHALRGDLDWIVMKCLEKDRARRYDAANALAMDVQHYLADEPVVARPPSKLYRFRKSVRRNKGAFAAVGAIALMLVLGVLASTWQAVRAIREQRIASRERDRAVRAEADARKAQASEAGQRAKAEANEKKALSEAAKSRQVSQLFKDMLRGVGPSVAKGRDTTVLREILDRTAVRLGNELTNQPEVELELRDTLGATYHELELYGQLEEMSRRGLEIARSRLADDPFSVAVFTSMLADALMHLGNLDESEKLARDALARQRELLNNEQISNESKAAISRSLQVLAEICSQRGRLPEAEAFEWERLALDQKFLGTEHPSVSGAYDQLARTLFQQNKFPEAEILLRGNLAIMKKFYGDEHPDIAFSLDTLAQVLQKQGKLEEAETAACEAVTMRKKLLGNDHVHVAYSLNNLANVLREQQRLTEAEAVYREALALQRKLRGNEHPYVAIALINLARVLIEQHKWPEAEASYREALALQRKAYGDVHPQLAAHIAIVTEALLAEKNFAEAEPLARQCLSIREEKLPGDWRTFNARSLLGACLLGLQKYAEAEPLLLSAYEGMKQQEDQIPADGRIRLRENIQRLVHLYQATGQSEKASEWDRKLAQFNQAESEKKTAVPKP